MVSAASLKFCETARIRPLARRRNGASAPAIARASAKRAVSHLRNARSVIQIVAAFRRGLIDAPDRFALMHIAGDDLGGTQSAVRLAGHEEPRHRTCHRQLASQSWQLSGLVAEKRTPALRWRPRVAAHIASDRRLSDLEAELEQFTMNVWSAPEWVRPAHLANERAQLSRDLRSASTVARSPAVGTENFIRID